MFKDILKKMDGAASLPEGGRVVPFVPRVPADAAAGGRGGVTGVECDRANRWNHPYRHWKFIAQEHKVDGTKRKPK